jgi:hypothetical protein
MCRQRIDSGPCNSAQKVNDDKSGDGTGNYLDQTGQTIRPNRHALSVLACIHPLCIHPSVSLPTSPYQNKKAVRGDNGHVKSMFAGRERFQCAAALRCVLHRDGFSRQRDERDKRVV